MNHHARFSLIAFIAACGTATAAPVADAAAVTQSLQRAGYAEVRDIEMDDGLYEAEVRRADGTWGEVTFDPSNGEVFDGKDSRPRLDEAGVRSALARAGYEPVTELERDGALWEADATTRDGKRVELRVSAFDGRVLSVEDDSPLR